MASVPTAGQTSTSARAHLRLVPNLDASEPASVDPKSLKHFDDVCRISGRLDRMAVAMHDPPRPRELAIFREALILWTLRLALIFPEDERRDALSLTRAEVTALVQRVRAVCSSGGMRIRPRAERFSAEYAFGGWHRAGALRRPRGKSRSGSFSSQMAGLGVSPNTVRYRMRTYGLTADQAAALRGPFKRGELARHIAELKSQTK